MGVASGMGSGFTYEGLMKERTVGRSIMPKSRPKITTPVIMVKNMRLEGTVTVLSISTERNVVSADVVSDRPIFVTAFAAR